MKGCGEEIEGPRVKIGIFDHVSGYLGGGQLVVARMAALLSQTYEVDVIHSGKGYTLDSLSTAFEINLRRAKERIVEDSLESFAVPGSRSKSFYLRNGLQADRVLTEPYDLFIYTGHGVPPFSFAKRAMVYCHFPLEQRPTVGMQASERWRRRHPVDRWIRLVVYEWIWDRRMRGYATVLGNSSFTSQWIERLWGRPAEVVYPPVAVTVPSVEKRNLIISVGRFVNADSKKHAQQLKAFPEFLSRAGGDWSLCMIGFCADRSQDRAYLEQLQHIAKDLPVTFGVNAERKAVLSYLAEAKLFWHTRGLGNEASTEPHHMEHFGMATVEAMMAGCVPLVPACGGQPEIVEHQVSGFLCHDLDTLVQHSVCLANNDQLRVRMSRRALERSREFHPARFEQRLSQRVFECLRDNR